METESICRFESFDYNIKKTKNFLRVPFYIH